MGVRPQTPERCGLHHATHILERMMKTTQDLLEQAKGLPLTERAALVDALLETIDAEPSTTKPIRSLDLDQLTNDEKLNLVEEIWDSISDADALPMTEAQRKEIERRLAEHLANPNDVVS